jgi:hypothetical protein
VTARLEITGTQDVAEALRKYGARAEAEIAKAVTATALKVNLDIKRRIERGPATGIKYWRVPNEKGQMQVFAGNPDGGVAKLVAVFGTGGKANLSLTHQSSAPGEAPATDTGTLARSIVFKQVSKLTAEVSSELKYAYYLEFGTDGGKIKPRPAWLPAIEKMRPEFAKRVADAIRKAAP